MNNDQFLILVAVILSLGGGMVHRVLMWLALILAFFVWAHTRAA